MSNYQLNESSTNKNIYYKHSGRINPLGLLLIPLFGILGAAILSIIYAYATVYIPFVYLNFFITLGYGIIISKLVIFGVKTGKVRNLKLLLLLGTVIAIFAEYFNWVSWIFVYTKNQIFVTSPVQILEVLKIIAAEGAWSIKHYVVKGGVLYFVWFVEAVIIMGIIIYDSYNTVKSMPFCEKCNLWIKDKITIPMLQPIIDINNFKSQLERKDYGDLLKLEKVDNNSSEYTIVELLSCPSCRQQHFLNIKSVNITTNSKGKKSENTNAIVENLIISQDTYSLIRDLNKI